MHNPMIMESTPLIPNFLYNALYYLVLQDENFQKVAR
jgi:hypothetical protein